MVGVGGSLHLHGLAGDPVQVILATDGTAGDPQGKYPPGEYGELRRAESRRAAALLGLGEPEFWGLGDGCEVSAEDRVQVTDMIAEVGLTEKRDVQSRALSGGMKRKLFFY